MQIITFGCRLNTFETAVMKQLAGHQLDDVIMVHTCAVTAEAERQCRQAIRQAARKNPDKKIIVAGCAAQLHPEVFAQMPEVYRVLGNHEKLDINLLKGGDKIAVGDLSEEPPQIPLIHEMEGRNRAFLQIQQGCDHACTFCIVHTLRGKNTGLPPEQVLAQARLFVEQGYPEIVLTGVDVASYPDGLWALSKRLLTEVKGLKRLRYGSLDPAMVGEELLELLAKHENLMPYIHLSVQSGDDLILKRMGRRHTRRDVLQFAEKLKKVRAEATLGADFIAGFPTETEAQFKQTLNLIREANITHTHIFPYSARNGTPAAKMPQVPKAERVKRAALARELGESLYQKALDNMVGKTVSVLVEQTGIGYTENYFPVRVGKSDLAGRIVEALIKGKEQNELVI
ncbi:MAG: tRNA (N(6)-L-threonylcarbamoyladenosine(37)-C(2))-methylthiotransferase MtaB [Alphaproteobacteria bacterium]|nr:tRNA (N(6)-L-threonylcarbamoyladenosine(37)-C(2))-methylthiotransferase MtaB [Alphaproteobacteria bacterium]